MSESPGAGAFGARLGSVVAFDERVGLGEVASADGTRYPFHCTQIADGTRRVTVGAPVEFEVRPGSAGQWEAASLRPPDSR